MKSKSAGKRTTKSSLAEIYQPQPAAICIPKWFSGLTKSQRQMVIEMRDAHLGGASSWSCQALWNLANAKAGKTICCMNTFSSFLKGGSVSREAIDAERET